MTTCGYMLRLLHYLGVEMWNRWKHAVRPLDPFMAVAMSIFWAACLLMAVVVLREVLG